MVITSSTISRLSRRAKALYFREMRVFYALSVLALLAVSALFHCFFLISQGQIQYFLFEGAACSYWKLWR